MPFSKDITHTTGDTLSNHRIGVAQFARRTGNVQLVVDSRTSKANKDFKAVKEQRYNYAWADLPQDIRDDYLALEAKLEAFIMANHPDFTGATNDHD